MAFVRLTNGKTATLKPEQALKVWDVLNGRREPENDKQSQFVSRIKRLYLNREYAPADYNEMYPQPITENVNKEQKLSWYQK